MNYTIYVPRLKHNILSIEKRSYIIINDTNHQVVATILMVENRMYMLKMKIDIVKCLKTTINLT